MKKACEKIAVSNFSSIVRHVPRVHYLMARRLGIAKTKMIAEAVTGCALTKTMMISKMINIIRQIQAWSLKVFETAPMEAANRAPWTL